MVIEYLSKMEKEAVRRCVCDLLELILDSRSSYLREPTDAGKNDY